MQYRFDQIAFNSTAKKKPTDDDKEHYIGLEHLDSDCLSVTRWGSDVAPTGEKLLMKKGDILFGKRRAYQRKVGIAPFDGIFSAHGMVLRPNEEVINKDFFPFFISSDQFMERAVRISVGGLSPTINWKDLREQEFELPSLDKQRVLADKLWAVYRLKESYKKLLVATDEMVKSQFIEMFGKGNWEQKCLGEIGTFKRGGGFQKSDYVEHGIPCIHYGQIHTKFGPFIYSHITEISTDLEPKTKFASKGDLIIAITSEDTEGSCKSTAWLGDYPVAVGGHAAIFHHCMNPLYMSFFFKSTLFNYAKMEYIHGTKVFEVKPDDIAKILVPCPPMSLQKQFSVIAQQADKSKFVGFKSQFIEMFGEPTYSVKTTLSDFVNLKAGKSKKADLIKDSYLVGSYPCYGGNGIRGYVSDYTHNGTYCIIGRQGAQCGNVQIAEGKFYATEHAVVVSPQVDVSPIWLFYALTQMNLNQYARGVAQPGLAVNQLERLPFSLPIITHQNQFAAIAQQADKSKLLHRKSIKYSKYSL